MRIVLWCAALALLVGCSTPAEDTPTSAQTTPGPTTVPSAAPSIVSSRLPSVEEWEPRDQDVEGVDIGWSNERDVEEVSLVWDALACLEPGTLPRAQGVIEGTYSTGELPAVIELASFDSPEQAREFHDAYLTGSLACDDGVSQLTGAESSLLRSVDGDSWTETLLISGADVTLAIVNEALTAEEVARLREALG
ncbi:MAG: hypothetical protein ACK5KO_12005 [Arachnia sp.]